MRSKLILASFSTLGLLFGMLLAIVLLVLYATSSLSIWLLFGVTIAVNILSWLFSPVLTDWIQKFFYKARYYNQLEFKAAFPQYAAFIAGECEKNNLPFPKIGFIADDNPTAFSYGSGQWNSRIVFTQGIQTYLEQDEAEAVLAHELGHVAHRDFAVMTIANAIIQLLYEIYYVFARGRGGGKKGSWLIIVGWIAYVFYWIGLYIVLYLNRLREYYADEFSAQTTGQPDALQRALVKVAYGIMAKEDSSKSARLLESTKTMGIMSLQSAKGTALAAKVSNMEPRKVAQVMLFDIVSPWAKLAQISATHPLTGRRLLRLDKMAAAAGKPAAYDIASALHSANIDKRRLWSGFAFGVFMYCMPFFTILAVLGTSVILYIDSADRTSAYSGIGFIIITALFLVRLFYRYPSLNKASAGNIYELMTNVYASPMRGYPVSLQGEVVGRGVPGYIFSEDMMLQDETGLLYLNYEGPFALFSNLVFALKRFKDFLGKPISAKGWFYRSNTQFLQLKEFQSGDRKIKSYPRLWGIVGCLIFAWLLSLLLWAVPLVKAARDQAAKSDYKCSYSVKNFNCVSKKSLCSFMPGDANCPVVTILNPCYGINFPAGSQITKTGTCDASATFTHQPAEGAHKTYKFSLASIPTDNYAAPLAARPSFSNIISDSYYPSGLSYRDGIAGLPAEDITYVSDPATHQLSEAWVIDSTSRLTSASVNQRYITVLTFDKADEDAFVKAEIANAASSLVIYNYLR